MPAMNRDPKELVKELVGRSHRILVITHVAPDGDAIGSLLGLGALLDVQGKETTLACEDSVPAPYTWLPGSTQVVKQSDTDYDLVISLDCSDQRRMGRIFGDHLRQVPLVNIDHHVTNTGFGTVNWVDPASVAAAQMVLGLANASGWELTEAAATCLLTGLVTDTRSFRTANVNIIAMRAALQLMEAGASLNQIAWRVLDQRSLASIHLWGRAFEGLQLQDGILWTVVTRAMRQEFKSNGSDDSGLANFLSGVREAKIIVVFTERDDGTIDVGMRSNPGYDVAQIALRLGGGGHPQAAGCSLEEDLSRAIERVLAEAHHSLEEQQMMQDA
jgi:phosphoesterase RecJ-like protein